MPIWHRRLTEHVDRHVSTPALVALYRRWLDHRLPDGGLPRLDQFDLVTLQAFAPNLMLLRQMGEDFHYEHFGSDIARHAQFDMTGRLVSSFGGELAEFFLDCYRSCLASASPLYTVHYADRARNVFTWERLLLPLVDAQGRPYLLVYTRPLQSRVDLQQQVLNATADAILALQPVGDDWLVLMVNDAMAALVGITKPAAAGQLASDVLLRWPDLGLDGPARALMAQPETTPSAGLEMALNLTVAGVVRPMHAHLRRITDGCVIRLTESPVPVVRAAPGPLASMPVPPEPPWRKLVLQELRAMIEQPAAELAVAVRELADALAELEHQPDRPEGSAADARNWLGGLRDSVVGSATVPGGPLIVQATADVPTDAVLPDASAWCSLAADIVRWFSAQSGVGSIDDVDNRSAAAAQVHLHLKQPPEVLPATLELLIHRPGARLRMADTSLAWERLRTLVQRHGGSLLLDDLSGGLRVKLPGRRTPTPARADASWQATLRGEQVPSSRGVPDVSTMPPSPGAPRVLVVEDDAVNQLVLRRQLELLGCHVELCPDGEEALLKWQSAFAVNQPFDLVLTDLHMPRLDGFALTREVRRREAAQMRAHMAILAVTANADHADGDLAVLAGVDAVLAKPVQLAQLRAALARWLGQPLPSIGPPATVQTSQALLDLDVLRRLLGGDEPTVLELLGDFRSAAVHLADEMRQAFRTGDASQLAAIAHKLKSASNAVGAHRLAELCDQLERRQLPSDPDAVSASLELFDRTLIAVLLRIDQHLSGSVAPTRVARPSGDE